MTVAQTGIVTPETSRIFGLSFAGWCRALVLALLIGGLIGWWWTGRDQASQQQQLFASEGQIADSRAAAVSAWVRVTCSGGRLQLILEKKSRVN